MDQQRLENYAARLRAEYAAATSQADRDQVEIKIVSYTQGDEQAATSLRKLVRIPAAAVNAYRYYIGWTSMSPTGSWRAGGTDVNRAIPIRNNDDVTGVLALLRKHYDDEFLSIVSFSRYED